MPNLEQSDNTYTSLSSLLTYINVAHQINRSYTFSNEAATLALREHEFWITKTQEAYYMDFTLR